MASEQFTSPCALPTAHEREILIILIEECSEVQQRATKMLRFGRDEVQRNQSLSNAERLAKEIGDLEVLIEMAVEEGLIDASVIRDRKPRKREKLDFYMQSRPAPPPPSG